MPIATLDEMLSDMEHGVFDYTQGGKCSGCGACCSNILPVSKTEISRIRAYIVKHGIREQKHTLPTVIPVTDWTCPFRDSENRKCTIYPVRPAICRDFRCDKPPQKIEADKNLYQGKYGIILMRQTFFG